MGGKPGTGTRAQGPHCNLPQMQMLFEDKGGKQVHWKNTGAKTEQESSSLERRELRKVNIIKHWKLGKIYIFF